MASPHAAGVAALIESQHPNMTPGAVGGHCETTADPIACPADVSIYAFFPAVDNGAPQVCTGGARTQLVQRPRPGERADGRHQVSLNVEGRRPIGRPACVFHVPGQPRRHPVAVGCLAQWMNGRSPIGWIGLCGHPPRAPGTACRMRPR